MSTTLWDLGEGDAAVLTGFAPDLAAAWLTRLTELGFRPGEAVHCVNAPRFGAPRTYRVNNTFFSVEDTVARSVLTAAEGIAEADA